MRMTRLMGLHALVIFLLMAGAHADETLFSFGPDFDPAAQAQVNAEVAYEHLPEQGVLRVTYQPVGRWPGLVLSPAGKKSWDLSAYEEIRVTLRNVGDKAAHVGLRVDSPKPPGDTTKPDRLSVGGGGSLEPGDETTLTARLVRRNPGAPVLVGMDRFPQGMVGDDDRVDPADVVRVVVFLNGPTHVSTLDIVSITAAGSYDAKPWEKLTADEFFPFVDKYGQFIHQSWPGKISTDEELQAAVEAERRDLAEHPQPSGWNAYGGWAEGPQLEATGRFRVAKHAGKWWLVDPDGRLFFAHGIAALTNSGGAITPIEDRENYFAWLPPQDGEWASCYSIQNRVSRGYYQRRQPLGFSFRQANQIRRYGEDWQDTGIALITQRMKSWGMNAMGCWTRPEVYSASDMPYAEWLFYRSRGIQGRMRGWKRFPDVFDPAYENTVRGAAKGRLAEVKDDPRCYGVFSDNELPWDTPEGMINCVLTSPSHQPAKNVFITDLRARYQTIDTLNSTWKTDFASWEAMRENREMLNLDHADADVQEFYRKLAHTYFRIARDAIKDAAPDLLYLGCRFNHNFPEASRVAAEYVDVMSYNLYRDSVASFELPAGVDKPVLIGEFHFGALDRGHFGDGLRNALDQDDRAAKYSRYVTGALQNPFIIGTHWFTYADEPVTGRASDQENHQIGFVGVTDTPYPEIVEASRQVGAQMYQTRLGQQQQD